MSAKFGTQQDQAKPIQPSQSLPLDQYWSDEEGYVRSLLDFATTSELFISLSGAVHILDFMTRKPDLYDTVLPEEWREWIDQVPLDDVLQLLLHDDIEVLLSGDPKSWPDIPSPPQSLLDYAVTVRRHCLSRSYPARSSETGSVAMTRRLAVGMKPKKIHEVRNFASYIDRLCDFVAEESGECISGLVDFGSGQNYLGRTLASPPYDRDVIAIERSHHNVTGARGMDINAQLVRKERVMRNKKEYKRQLVTGTSTADEVRTPTLPDFDDNKNVPVVESKRGAASDKGDVDAGFKRSITYVEHQIGNGCIEDIIYPNPSSNTLGESPALCGLDHDPFQGQAKRPSLMTISLHSCGNLSHHGLRTLSPSLNPSVSAVAIVGCCYNLLTQRLESTSYQHPLLLRHHRPETTTTRRTSGDPHGFPMSKRLGDFVNPDGSTGIRLDITARMMAVQAPYNWGKDDSDAFFTRHFYRALLQRLLMDIGVISLPSSPGNNITSGGDGQSTLPLVIGSMRKSAFTSFSAYVCAAMEKLKQNQEISGLIRSKSTMLTHDFIEDYAKRFAHKRKQLAATWTLMAFSAGVVESLIVVDRWLWLSEQAGWVDKCWVETVFDYKISPRNLVVVGIRKPEKARESQNERHTGMSDEASIIRPACGSGCTA